MSGGSFYIIPNSSLPNNKPLLGFVCYWVYHIHLFELGWNDKSGSVRSKIQRYMCFGQDTMPCHGFLQAVKSKHVLTLGALFFRPWRDWNSIENWSGDKGEEEVVEFRRSLVNVWWVSKAKGVCPLSRWPLPLLMLPAWDKRLRHSLSMMMMGRNFRSPKTTDAVLV